MFNPNNPIFNQMFGVYNNFQTAFSQFAQSFGNNPGQTAQQQVQQMLNSGQMSQQQFEQFRQLANQITGMNK